MPLLALLACNPPSGPEPPLPDEQPAQTLTPPETTQDDSRDFAPIALPQTLPAAVFTRTAPVSLVDERGAPLGVLTGHGAKLELRHALADRALVACVVCTEPVEGWVQTNLIMPEGHQPSDEESADPQLALALYAIQLRGAMEQGEPVAGLEADAAQRQLLLGAMDHGFAIEGRKAMAPASGLVYASLGVSVLVRMGLEGWYLREVELPPSPSRAAGH